MEESLIQKRDRLRIELKEINSKLEDEVLEGRIEENSKYLGRYFGESDNGKHGSFYAFKVIDIDNNGNLTVLDVKYNNSGNSRTSIGINQEYHEGKFYPDNGYSDHYIEIPKDSFEALYEIVKKIIITDQ